MKRIKRTLEIVFTVIFDALFIKCNNPFGLLALFLLLSNAGTPICITVFHFSNYHVV